MRGLRAACQSHVAKPVDPLELAVVVTSLVMRSRPYLRRRGVWGGKHHGSHYRAVISASARGGIEERPALHARRLKTVDFATLLR